MYIYIEREREKCIDFISQRLDFISQRLKTIFLLGFRLDYLWIIKMHHILTYN